MTGDSDPCFVDTNVLVYAHDLDAGERHNHARSLTLELWRSDRGCLSIQVLQEFFVTTTRRIPSPLDIGEATEAVEDYARWAMHTPNPADVLEAIDIHRRFDISFWDAMVINSAAQMGCRIVYSEDLNAGQQYGSVGVVNPFA